MDSVWNMINTKDGTNQFIINKAHLKLFTTYTEQIFIFRHFHEVISIKRYTLNKDETVYNSLKQNGIASEKYTFVGKFLVYTH